MRDGTDGTAGTGEARGATHGATHGATALDLPETRSALDRYRARARGWTVGGLIVVAAGALFAALGGGGWGGQIAGGCVAPGVGAFAVGSGALVTARRMRRVLAAGPWTAHPAVLLPRGMNGVTVVLGDAATREAFPLVVRAVQQRFRLARPDAGGVMWWCGDPLRGGVLAQPGGGAPIWTAPVRGRNTRRLLVRRAADQGLLGLGRDAPVTPLRQP